jgi:hypothetical protein
MQKYTWKETNLKKEKDNKNLKMDLLFVKIKALFKVFLLVIFTQAISYLKLEN